MTGLICSVWGQKWPEAVQSLALCPPRVFMHQFTLVLLSCRGLINLKGSSSMVNLARLFVGGGGERLITRNKLREGLKIQTVNWTKRSDICDFIGLNGSSLWMLAVAHLNGSFTLANIQYCFPDELRVTAVQIRGYLKQSVSVKQCGV